MSDTSLIEQLLEWIQQHKHLYMATKTASLKATDYVRFMVVQNWPIICSWSVYFGRLFLVMAKRWLNCSLRGMGSLLHVSSAAYYMLLWCTVLSTTSMSGLLFVLISLGIAYVAEPLLGFAPTIIILATLGATMLWVYGSFWITGALIIIGGSLFDLNHARLIVLIATIYSMYCAKVCTGWFGLVFCINLAFISNDILNYLLKTSGKENESKCPSQEAEETTSSAKKFNHPPQSTTSNCQSSKSHKTRPSSESSQSVQSAQTVRESSTVRSPSKSHESRSSGESSQTGQSAQTIRKSSNVRSPSKSHESRSSGKSSQTGQSAQTFGEPSTIRTPSKSHETRPSGESSQTGQSAQAFGESSTIRSAKADPSLADEVLHILHSSDHYATLGLSRYEEIDMVVLKRDYRKKAVLVHPDKNMGNLKAEESFKKLQSAYEVLSNSDKKCAYDEELRRDELTKSSHQKLQCGAQKNGKHNNSKYYSHNYEKEGKDNPAVPSIVACRKCNKSHKWIFTNRSKCQARWCQDCEDYHQAKDGDGWMECYDHVLMFGMPQKGLNCLPNTHNPSFQMNGMGKNTVYRSIQTHRGSGHASTATNIEEYIMQEQLFEWLHMTFSNFDSANGSQGNRGLKRYYVNRNLQRNGNRRW
ncbi:uncharacterized protein LOC131041053 isoform X2 [Cryptomeria japonica]|uniref:uncharacterized protein LOC131041053 isoform X2 n=1 Tax=Cryptomeria japonica TaxID=3369 RepID=UPI0027D9E98B|nr:uncharacterized protein LOC131041053 isoform X2 [Cryptomeria japonica]